jgi:WhiB family transcriptional regulator, redox-sensing transcriptional regulator
VPVDIVTTLYGRQERSWQLQANCMGVDPDLFFPERGASTREAKEVCRGCVVREDCLEYALANGEKFGIWGGMSERERRRLRRARALGRIRPRPLADVAPSGRRQPPKRASTVDSSARPSSTQRSRGMTASTASGTRPTSSAPSTDPPASATRATTSS